MVTSESPSCSSVRFKPETAEYFTALYSQNRDLVEQMLLSENVMDQAVAKTILTITGVLV